MDELKADIKAKALERKEKSADDAVENQIIDVLVDGLKGEIPEAMFRSRVEQSIKDFDYRLQMQGMNLETYMQYMGGNVDALKENFRPQAERQVKVRLALEKIVELEKIEVSAEDLDKEFSVMAETYSMTVEQIKAAIPEADIAADIAVQKAMALIKENAKITEVKEYTKKEEEQKESKPAAKKPAAKKTTTTKKAADGEKKAPAKKPAAKKTTKTEDAE